MAAIRVHDNKAWVGAAWILDHIARRLSECGKFPQLNEQFSAIEAGWQYLDVSQLDARERDELRSEVSKMVLDEKRRGPASMADPKFYGVYIGSLEELENLVRDNVSE